MGAYGSFFFFFFFFCLFCFFLSLFFLSGLLLQDEFVHIHYIF